MSDAGRWLKIREAADRARCGPKTIYRAVRGGQLRAARIGGRRELRFLSEWIDLWLIGQERSEQEDAGRQNPDALHPRLGRDNANCCR